MDKDYSFKTEPSLFEVFSPLPLTETITNYHIKEYYYLDQIHSTIVNIVDDNYLNNTKGDAMITTKKNVGLVIRTADCISIVLYDKNKEVLATIHSGWKGTLNNIVKSTIETMIKNYHTNPEDLQAYLYPSIRKCHFEVKEDVYNQFKDKITNIDKYITNKTPNYYIDLQSIVIDSLKDMKVTNIQDANICTYCHHDKYHSYRYNHTDARNYLVAMIKE